MMVRLATSDSNPADGEPPECFPIRGLKCILLHRRAIVVSINQPALSETGLDAVLLALSQQWGI
jgi:hypothetical protein